MHVLLMYLVKRNKLNEVECAVWMVKDLVAKAPMCASSNISNITSKPYNTAAYSNSNTTATTRVRSIANHSQASNNTSLASSSKVSSTRSPVLSATSIPVHSVTTNLTSATNQTSYEIKPVTNTAINATESKNPKSKIISLPKIFSFLDTINMLSVASLKNTPTIDFITEVVKCEPRFVPFLISQREWTIKHI